MRFTTAEIAEHLNTSDEPLVIRGFGTFRVVLAAARTVRNPRTGEKVEVPARRRVRFTPSPKLLTVQP